MQPILRRGDVLSGPVAAWRLRWVGILFERASFKTSCADGRPTPRCFHISFSYNPVVLSSPNGLGAPYEAPPPPPSLTLFQDK